MKPFKFLYFFLTFLLLSCSSESLDVENFEDNVVVISYEDSVLKSKVYITTYLELSNDCFDYFEKKVSQFYCDEESSDSLYKIFKLSADLFPKHYSQSESDKIEKYAGFIQKQDSVQVVYFGINKLYSDFIFLNELEVNPAQPILTKEEHLCWSTDFSFLEESGCLELDLISNNEIAETYRSVGTFEHNSENIWVIDSISKNNQELSVFYELDTFTVLNNNEFKGKSSLKYFFNEDWGISFVTNNKDTVGCKVISFSENARIVWEIKNGVWTYMRKLKTVANNN